MDNEPTSEEIATRAYEIYERNGRVDGRALDDWLAARAALRAAAARSDNAEPDAGVDSARAPASARRGRRR